jgi:hypothetical protein
MTTRPDNPDGAAPDPAALPPPFPPAPAALPSPAPAALPSPAPAALPSPAPAALPSPAPWLAGGCSRPIVLVGRTDTIHPGTGEVLDTFDLPGGRLLVPCGDRRAAVCPACARRYRDDTRALVRLGLAGGRMVPPSVTEHPAVFATFTPPGLGPVHTTRTDRTGRQRGCRPRRTLPRCEHDLPASCAAHHGAGDPLVGQPLCLACYDYPGAVLWQAHAGRLWDRTAQATRRALATHAGLPMRRFAELARLSFVRVAEYQRRGLIHLHAVVRLDGRDGPGDLPPTWASTDALAEAVRAAHESAVVLTPYSPAYGEWEIRWGAQLDVQPVDAAATSGSEPGPAERGAVAAYLAKYASKSTHDAGVPLKRMRRLSDMDTANLTPHSRAIITTCWHLGGLVEYRHLRLRAWAHTLGWRGHTSTKSRRYSTTLAVLREARAEHQRDQSGREAPPGDSRPQGAQTVLDRSWRYVGRTRPPDAGGGRW